MRADLLLRLEVWASLLELLKERQRLFRRARRDGQLLLERGGRTGLRRCGACACVSVAPTKSSTSEARLEEWQPRKECMSGFL